MIYHRTLDRQLRKFSIKGLSMSNNFDELLGVINDTYNRYDKDIKLIYCP